MKLTIYHDGQFWVGVAEQAIDGKVRAVQHIFGPEPHDEEVLKFVNQQLFQLFNQANAIIAAPRSITKKSNPKRLAREAAREVKSVGASTYAQQAIKLELEQRKQVRQKTSREEKESERDRKWQLKRQQAKAKQRGH